MSLQLTSPAFADGGLIPAEHTCDGANTMPPLTIADVPSDAKSLVLVMDDPDIPQEVKDVKGIEKFDHLALYNIPSDTETISESSAYPAGLTSAGTIDYVGPCPPADLQPREHRYVFRLYALPEPLDFDEPPTLDALEVAAQAVALDSAALTGRYARQPQ